MAGPQVLDLANFRTHRAEPIRGLFLNEIISDAGNPTRELQESLAGFVVGTIRRMVITHTLEIGRSVLDWPQAKDSFDDELRGISLDSMAKSKKPTPKWKEIPKRRNVNRNEKQNAPNHRASDDCAGNKHQKPNPSRRSQG